MPTYTLMADSQVIGTGLSLAQCGERELEIEGAMFRAAYDLRQDPGDTWQLVMVRTGLAPRDTVVRVQAPDRAAAWHKACEAVALSDAWQACRIVEEPAT
jgi:hypothetical protein